MDLRMSKLKWILGWEHMSWIDLPQSRDKCYALMDTVMNLWIPQISQNFSTSWGPVSFSGWTLLHGLCLFIGAEFHIQLLSSLFQKWNCWSLCVEQISYLPCIILPLKVRSGFTQQFQKNLLLLLTLYKHFHDFEKPAYSNYYCL